MSSIYGVSSSSTAGLQGYGGLASGLDRDSLIEDMLYGTQSKITAQEQKKQLVEWEMQSIWDVTDPMYEFTQKYTSFTSPDNLLLSSSYQKNDISVSEKYEDIISVSGNGNMADEIKILGVKSLAQNAQLTTSGTASNQTLSTSIINEDLSATFNKNMIEGGYLTFKYGSGSHTIYLSQNDENNYDYTTAAGVAEAINTELSELTTALGDPLSDSIKATASSDGTITFSSTDNSGNGISLSGGSDELLTALGLKGESEMWLLVSDERKAIDADGLSGSGPAQITKEMTLAETLSGEKMSFEYNGERIEIELSEYTSSSTIDDLISDIQDAFDREVGKGRVLVERDSLTGDSAINITTTKPPGTELDPTSTLSVADDTNGLTGINGVFGFSEGDSNRVNLEESFANSGLVRSADTTAALTITNDGETLDLEALGLSWDSSVEDIIEAINADDKLGITVTYQEMTDKFIVTSKEEGAGGNIELSGAVADALFGTSEGTDFTKKTGEDSVIYVEFQSTGERVEISRGSNDINIEGMTINVSGTFGYDETGYIEGTEAVKLSSSIDSEDMTERVKTMIDEYNELIASINEAISTKPNRDYAPLTAEERSQLSESQIESWEEEAMKGLLFGDTDMRALADDLRFILPAELREDFEEIGISVSTSYLDNGKLIFDEVKFAAAFESDPSKVQELLATPDTNNEDAPAGLVVEMKSVMDKYASMTGSTKGILVERAGSKYSPVAALQNSLMDEIDIIDGTIDNLTRQMQMEEDRYISEFTALEMLISEMNSQSSYLSSMFTSA